MKRKLFLAIIAVLVVCLMCGVLFVACNDDPPSPGTDDPIGPVDPDNPDPGDEEDELTKSDVFIDLVKNFDAVEQDTTGEKEFTFGLQIKDRADQTSVFSIALENVGGKDYLYGAVGTTVFTKFNGFDLGETFMTILNWLGPIDLSQVVGIQAGLDVKSLTNPLVAGIVSDMLIGDFAVSESGDAYMVELSISKVLATIGTFVDLDAVINGALGEDTVTTVVNALAGVIGIELAEGSATVTGLLNAIANAYQVNFYFGFDSVTADDADPFGGLLPGVQEARDLEAQNLLKFSVDGTVAGYDNQTEGEGEDAQVVSVNNHNYAINVDVDIDPFVLFGILDMVQGNGECLLSGVEINPAWKLSFNGTPEEIVALVKQMGGIDITVDEVDAEGNVIMNVLTLYYDGGDYAVAALQTHAALSMARLGMGGVYDVDALGEVIEMLITDGAAASDETGTPAEGGESGLDIMGIIQMVLACVDYDNIAVDGLTIDFATLVPKIVKLIIPETDGLFNTVNGAVMNILGSDSLNFKFGQFNFGTATIRPVEEVTGNLRMMGNYFGQEGMYNGLVSEITSIPGLENGAEIDLGSSITSGMTGANAGYSDIFVFNGTDLAGNAVQTSGIIMNTVGFDPNTLGTQNVTVYVGVVTDFYFSLSTINQFMGDTPIVLDPMWPFFGVLKYETTIEVVEPTGLEATLTDVTDGTLSLVAGRSIAVVNDGVFKFTMAGTGALAQMHVIVWDAASSSLVVVDAITQQAIPGFEVTNITLTSSDVLPSPIGLTTGLAADPSSVVVGEGSAWLGFWGTAGTIQFELTYNGQPVIFNGVANNTFNYAVN